MENPCKIITFGDSITLNYTDRFREQITRGYGGVKIEVINAGVVGETSTQGLSRIQTIIDKKPDVIVVGFGMNDWRKGVSQDTFRNNLRTIVAELEENKVRVLLMTIPPVHEPPAEETNEIVNKYTATIRDVAEEKRIRIADVNSLWKREIKPIKKGLSDAIHPNKLGYEVICKSLMRVVPLRNTTVVWQFDGEYCACNYACPYCYVPGNVNVAHHFVGPMSKWHDAFKKTFGNQHVTFYISFGEPVLSKVFYELVEMIATEPNWEMMMTSNLSLPLDRLVKTKLAKEGRLNINASFHPTETTIDKFLKQVLFLREHGIESPIVYVMYQPIMKYFERYFRIFDRHNFLVHVRRFRGWYNNKWYPEAYTEQERRFVAKYMDDASIKYMLNETNIKGKLSYTGMYHIIVTNEGDVTPATDYMCDRSRGNVLQGNVKLDTEPWHFLGSYDGTVDGVAALLETGYQELEKNHVTTFAEQGGVYHMETGVHYPHMHTDFSDPFIRRKLNFPSRWTKIKNRCYLRMRYFIKEFKNILRKP